MQVEINKHDLKEILLENKRDHKELFEEAHEAFRKKAVENLEARIQAVKNNEKISLHINLREPTDQTDDYTRALEMLDREVKETITLDEQEYSTLVNDDWSWTHAFADSYTNNTGKAFLSKRDRG